MKKNFLNIFLLLVIIQSKLVYSENLISNSAPVPKIGFLLTLSGTLASAGEDCRKGIEAAIDLSGKRGEIAVVYGDSQDNPKIAINEFFKLTQINRVAAIYTHRSTIGMPLNPISNEQKIPLLGAVGHQDFATKNPYAFQFWPSSDYEGAFLAENLIKEGRNEIAILTSEDEWMSSVSTGFREKFLELGGKIIFDQAILPSETDFLSILLKLKQKKPSTIFFNLARHQIGLIIKQSRQLNIDGNYYSNFWASYDDTIKAAGKESMKGIKYVEINTELSQLKNHLKIKEGKIPSLTLTSFLGTLFIIDAVTNSNDSEITTSKKIYDYMISQTEILFFDFKFQIKDRKVLFPLVIREIE